MANRVAVTLVAIVVIAALALLIATQSDPEPSRPAAGQRRGDAVVEEIESMQGSGGPEGDASRESVTRPGAGESAPVFELRVRVVDSGGDPVRGAEVAFHAHARADEPVVRQVLEERVFAGPSLISDSSGIVRITEASDQGWTVFARTETDWGVLWISPVGAGEVHVLRLAHDILVRARVVDAAGSPVHGVEVLLADELAVERGLGGRHALTVAPAGVATFDHVQAGLPRDWGDDAVLAIACPLPERTFVKVDLADPPERPVDLVLPAVGSVRIVLVDRGRGRLGELTEGVSARLSVGVADRERRRWVHFDHDTLELPNVGLGLTLRLEIDSPDVSGSLALAGPAFAGERVERRLEVDRHATISGRLVDERSAPLEGYWFASHLHAGRGHYNQYFETTADGLFHIGVPEFDHEVLPPRRIVFRRTVPDPKRQAIRVFDDVVTHGGRNELGDVVLTSPPVLVAGRIVDDLGEPVVGASLSVSAGAKEESWPVPGLEDRDDKSGSDGAFEIRGHAVADELLLSAELDGNRGSRQRFRAGTRGVEYVLPRRGAIELPVEFDGAVTAEDVLHELVERSTGATRSVVSHYVLEAGVVRWTGLRPGRYDLSARLLGSVVPLFSITDVIVEGGATERLSTQRIGAEVDVLRVFVTDLAGQPVDGASVVVDPDGLSELPRAALRTVLGELRLKTAKLPVELLVFAPGFSSRRVLAGGDEFRVRLDAGLEVELQVSLPDGFPADGQRLIPRLRRYDPADPDPQPWGAGHDLYLRGAGATYYPSRHGWLWNEKLPLDSGGKVTLRVPAAGEYTVDWVIAGGRELSAAARRVFTVAPGSVRTTVALALGEDDVR